MRLDLPIVQFMGKDSGDGRGVRIKSGTVPTRWGPKPGQPRGDCPYLILFISNVGFVIFCNNSLSSLPLSGAAGGAA